MFTTHFQLRADNVAIEVRIDLQIMIRKRKAIGALLAACVAITSALLQFLLMTLRAVLSLEREALIL